MTDSCVTRVPMFQALNPAEQQQVASVAVPRRVARGETIYMEGDELSQLIVLHHGEVKLSRTSADGHEHIIRVLGTGDFIGELAFLGSEVAQHRAIALSDATMCTFPHSRLKDIVSRYPGVSLAMMRDIATRLAATEQRLARVVAGDVGERLAAYLLDLPTHPAPGAGVPALRVRLPMAKKDIASLLDTTPESLSRQLRKFEDAGFITVTGRDVVITDIDGLMCLADTP